LSNDAPQPYAMLLTDEKEVGGGAMGRWGWGGRQERT